MLHGEQSLGRKLYLKLDLWETAYPFLEQWIKEQHHPKKLFSLSAHEWKPLLEKAIKVPGMTYDILEAFEKNQRYSKHFSNETFKETKHGVMMYAGILTTIIGLIGAFEPNLSFIPWIVTALDVVLWIHSLLMRTGKSF